MKRIAKNVICTALILSLSAPSAVFAQDGIRTAPLKSFFTRFLKTPADKNAETQNDKKVQDKKPKKENKIKKFIKKKGAPKQDDANISDAAVIKGGVALSIEDCVKFALKNDPNVKNARQTQLYQKGAVGVAKSNYFPSIFAGTGYNLNNKNYFSGMDGSLNNNNYGINAGITEKIWDFGYTTAKINMNKFNWEASGYDLENAMLKTTYTTKIDYTAVLAARANEDIYARSVRINKLNVDRTKAMYEVGLKSKIDLVNAQANLTDAQINLVNAQNSYQTALITLNNDMYYIDAPEYSIKDTETFNFQKTYSVKNEVDVAYDRKNYNAGGVDAEIKDGAILTSSIEKRDILKTYNFRPFDLTMQEAIQKAYDNRPDLKSMILVKQAAAESLKAVKKSYYPVINANAQYNMQKFSDYGSHQIAAYAGIDIPTVNAMAIKNQIEQGKANLEIADNNIDLLRKNIYFQIQTYYVNMKKLERTIPLMSKKVQETLENFELADGRYAVGLANYLELQQAQTDYNNAQLAFVQSVFEYNQARFYLEKSMGVK